MTGFSGRRDHPPFGLGASSALVAALPHAHKDAFEPPFGIPGEHKHCLTESDASFLVNGFIDHIATNFNQTWGDRLIAVIDLDSPTPARFDAEDQAGCEALAALLAERLG